MHMPKQNNDKNKKKITHEKIRIGNVLNDLILIKDDAGNIIHKILKPTMVEFHPRDVMQTIVGATILAIPLSYTQEVWEMGERITNMQAGYIALVSMTFMGLFVYYNYYKNQLREHVFEFFKRIITTYVISMVVAYIILTLIGQTQHPEIMVAIKRTILVAFPASMSAAITDTIK